jgi:hypothetical protein
MVFLLYLWQCKFIRSSDKTTKRPRRKGITNTIIEKVYK